ncbi:MAG: 1-acyl-sn-glycerol-3-phosphate acyltransferase [Proteobacteria bacterium]|nr:1-acyl-sn-glycerol-3-phosphate acyltransferase [Pseudomonadota bacterium]
MRAVWILGRALYRLFFVVGYLSGLYLATYTCYFLPRFHRLDERIRFARRYYFQLAELTFNLRLHVENNTPEHSDEAASHAQAASHVEATSRAEASGTTTDVGATEHGSANPADADVGVAGNAQHDRDDTDVGARYRLYVCNHISWMDILVLYHVLPIRFISKSEVARWIFIGHLARWAGTIFLARGRGGKEVLKHTVQALHHNSVVLFAEGTSTDGRQVRRFLPPIFRAAADASVDVVPVTLCYRSIGYNPSGLGVAYSDSDSMIQSIWRTLLLDRIDIFIRVHPALEGRRHSSGELATAAHKYVADGLNDLRRRHINN